MGCAEEIDGEVIRTAPLVRNEQIDAWVSTKIVHPNDTAIIAISFTPLYSGASYVGLSILSGGTPVYVEAPIIDTTGLDLGGNPQIPLMFQADSEINVFWKIRFPQNVHPEYIFYPYAFMDSMIIDGVGMQFAEAQNHAPPGSRFPSMIWSNKPLVIKGIEQ